MRSEKEIRERLKLMKKGREANKEYFPNGKLNKGQFLRYWDEILVDTQYSISIKELEWFLEGELRHSVEELEKIAEYIDADLNPNRAPGGWVYIERWDKEVAGMKRLIDFLKDKKKVKKILEAEE